MQEGDLAGPGNLVIGFIRQLSVHPHRRGERDSRSSTSNPKVGSSPQAWGTVKFCRDCFYLVRFIPTGVGNGPVREAVMYFKPVHPHRRGERILRELNCSTKPGSSPQAWGTELVEAEKAVYERFIPTGVGNGIDPLAKVQALAVHPHRRGERVSARAVTV